MRAHRKTDFTDIYQTSSTPHIKNLPWYGVSAYARRRSTLVALWWCYTDRT